MSLTMTPEDICKEYRTAKSPLKQIGVLAELNACPKGEIIKVLRDNGEKLPGNVGPRKAAEADLTAADVNYEEKPAAPEPCEVPAMDVDALCRLGVVKMLILKAFGGDRPHDLEDALLLYEDMRKKAGLKEVELELWKT